MSDTGTGDSSSSVIVRAAERYERLERVADAAELFLRHIAGYRIAGTDGEVRDLMHADIPEAVALAKRLDELRGY